MGVLPQLFAFLFLVGLTSALVSQIGDGCVYDDDCTNFAFCESQQRCSCKQGFGEFTANDLTRQCAPNLGSACNTDDECSIQSSQCLNSVCVCRSGFVSHPNTQECLTASSGFRSPCVEDIQCTSLLGDDATCFMQKCICKEGFHDFDNKCIQTKALGETCNLTRDCYINDEQRSMVVCSPKSNKCACKSSSQVYENSCKSSGDHLLVSVVGLLLGFVFVRRLS